MVREILNEGHRRGQRLSVDVKLQILHLVFVSKATHKIIADIHKVSTSTISELVRKHKNDKALISDLIYQTEKKEELIEVVEELARIFKLEGKPL